MNKITSKWSKIFALNNLKTYFEGVTVDLSESYFNNYKRDRKEYYNRFIKQKLGKRKRDV